MSLPESFNRQVSVEECEEMRSRFEAGESVPTIAADVEYVRTTVRDHVADRCEHRDPTKGNTGHNCPYCGAEDIAFRSHLPCEEVDDV